MTKEDIISLINIKDYNNILESILETKDFSEDVKNLLLSMLYKIENSYEDYKTVKVDSISKKKYIENLLQIINDCKNITLTKTKNELSILIELQKMDEKQIVLKEKYDFYEKAFKEALNIGFISNSVEVIRDFNGWSWDINEKEIKDINYNIIYQNMLMIFGNEFLNCVINNCMQEQEDDEINIPNNEILRSKYSQIASFEEDNNVDYINEMQQKLKKEYGEELAKNIEEKFLKVILIMISNKDNNQRKQIINKKNENDEIFEKMQNKKEYLEEITNKKKQLMLKIKEIDKVVNNNKTLKEKYEENNKKLSNKDKIFSASQYANNLIIERKEILKEINKINKIMEPNEFVKVKEEKQNKKEFFEPWNVGEKKINEEPYIEELQKDFLEALLVQMKNAQTKKEIIELIYRLRYYKYLPFESKKMYEVESLKEKIQKVEEFFIKKACERKVITRLSDDDSLNFEILSNIFLSKIINLENINIILEYNKDTLLVEIYDGNTIENRVEIKIKQKTELSVKLKKKIKVFIK